MVNRLFVKYKNVSLRPLCENDIEYLRVWRNNSELTKYMQPLSHITREDQKSWFLKNKEDENILTLAIEVNGFDHLVGSCSLYNFDEKDKACEFGRILIGDSLAHGKQVGFYSTVLCLYTGLELLKYETINAFVNVENIPAIKCYWKAGFDLVDKRTVKYDNNQQEYFISISNERFCKLHDVSNISVECN